MGKKSAHTYWHGYVSPTNPFKPSGFIGSCQFPQITAEGLDDSWRHGFDLYSVYGELLHFLPHDVSRAVSFRVTQNTITSQVAGMVINGMFDTENDFQLVVEVCLITFGLIFLTVSAAQWLRFFGAYLLMYHCFSNIQQ